MESIKKSPLYKALAEQAGKLKKVASSPTLTEGNPEENSLIKRKLQPDPQTPLTPAQFMDLESKRLADIARATRAGYEAGCQDTWERRSQSSVAGSSTSSRTTQRNLRFMSHLPLHELEEENDQSLFQPSVVQPQTYGERRLEEARKLLDLTQPGMYPFVQPNFETNSDVAKQILFRQSRLSNQRKGSDVNQTLVGPELSTLFTPRGSGGPPISKRLDMNAEAETFVPDGEAVSITKTLSTK